MLDTRILLSNGNLQVPSLSSLKTVVRHHPVVPSHLSSLLLPLFRKVMLTTKFPLPHPFPKVDSNLTAKATIAFGLMCQRKLFHHMTLFPSYLTSSQKGHRPSNEMECITTYALTPVAILHTTVSILLVLFFPFLIQSKT